jgi:hypothetical protein
VAALVPSAGAITTANRVAFGADVPQHPYRDVSARGARSVSSKAAKIMEVRSILHEPSFTRLLLS